jgi:hypothetical protein
MAAGPTDAKCVNPEEQAKFQSFLTTCMPQIPGGQVLPSAYEKYIGTFETLRGQTTDLLQTGDKVSILADTGANTTAAANERVNALSRSRDLLRAEKQKYRRQAETADKAFLEDIMHGNPQGSSAMTLQDATLLLFFFSWLIMTIALVAVRWGSPGGSFASAVLTLVLMLFVTTVLYGLIRTLA